MPNRKIFTNLSNFYRPFINRLNVHLAPHNLSNSHWNVMRTLKNEESLTFQDIAKANHIEKPSASSLIHKLIASGYVETVEGTDKRSKLVRLTPLGEQVYDEILHIIDKWLETLVEGIPEENKLIVENALEVMIKNLKK
ncbi:MarR family winged helix-turn-helix transcriptional regulator [Fredinandcohnia sp. 179-A 10B2 NHS]|uniref:MarR family winged helix-turn-helix transcriptional regulator n=1 Tax=Fredinandcohnia sp. 179-A 10B2 NHS TaxID=3235176 RepID=UPI0039A2EAD0